MNSGRSEDEVGNAGDDITTQPTTSQDPVPMDTTPTTTNSSIALAEKYQVPAKPSTPQEEKAHVKQIETNQGPLKLGAIWYVLATKWWKNWKEYVQYDWTNSYGNRPPPGPIDNSSILEEQTGNENVEPKIKKGAMETYDYAIISEETWATLQHWYGGGPALPRKVIGTGWDSSNLVVEVRPLTLKIVKSSTLNDHIVASASKSDTVGQLKKVMCKRMELEEEDVRIWDYHAFSKYKLLENMDQKLEAAQIIDGQPILLEEKGPDGKFPELPKKTSSYSYGGYSSSAVPTDPGATGLVNLGNTCFMNSSLQCLSNTAPLTEYFLTDKYKTDINADNPLGMKGELAEEYASLVKELWAGTHSAVAPRDFKWKLERFAPAFSGYQQHDAQELLSFLLDGLHEDLNRVKKKPYRERPETQEKGDAQFSQDLWEYHRERNDSIIVDWFQGQLKSTLHCPKCDRISITFDPMMYLSLPLPIKLSRTIYVNFFFLDPTKKPTKYGVEVNKMGTIADLKAALAQMAGVKAEPIAITDVYNGRFFKVFSDKESLDAIQERDIICGYELYQPEEEDECVYLQVVSRREEPVNYHPYYSSSTYTRKSLFGLPFILSVPKEITYSDLYTMVYKYIQKYFKGLPQDKIIEMINDSESEEEEEPQQQEQEQPAGATKDEEELKEIKQNDETFHDDSTEDSSESSEDERPQQSAPVKKKMRKQPLFVLRLVDMYGMTDQEILKDDGQPLTLPERATLGIIWTEEMLDAFYDETKERDIVIHESCHRSIEHEDDTVELGKCIDMFLEEEQLSPEDAWFCSTCKEHVQATKKFDLWKLPPILVVHLKRFSYKKRYYLNREKLETFVDYPIHDLDLSRYINGPSEQPPVYELYAVSNHFGGLGSGHYTAFGKNRLDNKWYKFDDSSVSPVDENRVKTSSGYVLFYRRKDTIPDVVNNNNNSTPAAVEQTPEPMEQDNLSNDTKTEFSVEL